MLRNFAKVACFKLILWHIEVIGQVKVSICLVWFCDVNCFFANQNPTSLFEFPNVKFGKLNHFSYLCRQF